MSLLAKQKRRRGPLGPDGTLTRRAHRLKAQRERPPLLLQRLTNGTVRRIG